MQQCRNFKIRQRNTIRKLLKNIVINKNIAFHLLEWYCCNAWIWIMNNACKSIKRNKNTLNVYRNIAWLPRHTKLKTRLSSDAWPGYHSIEFNIRWHWITIRLSIDQKMLTWLPQSDYFRWNLNCFEFVYGYNGLNDVFMVITFGDWRYADDNLTHSNERTDPCFR